MNLNGIEYYYIRNAQGDIIGLNDKAGTQVVSYIYDSWGKPVVTDTEQSDVNDIIKDGITGSDASTVGVKNPYRYRGYRYDTETSLYYLQSRYYNAEWGRFVNADAIAGNVGVLLSHNVFAYVQNNPVMNYDPSGYILETVLDVASAVYSGYQLIKNPSLANLAFLAWDVGAAALPFVPGSYVGRGVKLVKKVVGKAPKNLSLNSKQIGSKWGKHKTDYPKMKNYTEYKNFSNDIFKNPEKIICDKVNNEYLYVRGNDLLRVKTNGEFISTYPGASSSRVTNAIKNGGVLWVRP